MKSKEPSPGSPGRTVHFQAERCLTSAGSHSFCTTGSESLCCLSFREHQKQSSCFPISELALLAPACCSHRRQRSFTPSVGQSGLGTLSLSVAQHFGHTALHWIPFLDRGAPFKFQQQGGRDGDGERPRVPQPLGSCRLSLESSPWAPALLARGTRLMFSNTKWSCLQMPSKSQNSPNLPSFMNRLQPTPVTIAACLCASLQLCGGTALRG